MYLDGMISGAIGPRDPHPFLGVDINFDTMEVIGPLEYSIWNRSTSWEAKYS